MSNILNKLTGKPRSEAVTTETPAVTSSMIIDDAVPQEVDVPGPTTAEYDIEGKRAPHIPSTKAKKGTSGAPVGGVAGEAGVTPPASGPIPSNFQTTSQGSASTGHNSTDRSGKTSGYSDTSAGTGANTGEYTSQPGRTERQYDTSTKSGRLANEIDPNSRGTYNSDTTGAHNTSSTGAYGSNADQYGTSTHTTNRTDDPAEYNTGHNSHPGTTGAATGAAAGATGAAIGSHHSHDKSTGTTGPGYSTGTSGATGGSYTNPGVSSNAGTAGTRGTTSSHGYNKADDTSSDSSQGGVIDKIKNKLHIGSSDEPSSTKTHHESGTGTGVATGAAAGAGGAAAYNKHDTK